jgi:hypothetical protein
MIGISFNEGLEIKTGQHDINFVLLHTFKPIVIQYDRQHCHAVLSLVEILVEGQNFYCAVIHQRVRPIVQLCFGQPQSIKCTQRIWLLVSKMLLFNW